MNRGPEEYGHDGDDRDGAGIGREGTHDDGAAAPEHLTPQDAPPGPPAPGPLATADFGPPAVARTVQVVSGDFLLTVNPVDGSEIEPCPPGEQPGHPPKHSAVERAERRRAAQPPVPPGPALPRLPLLERQEERERLVRLLARGRSVRLTGPAGSGRTALLAAVAEDCADLAPDGVIRLSGYHRTVGDLLYDLFAAVHDAHVDERRGPGDRRGDAGTTGERAAVPGGQHVGRVDQRARAEVAAVGVAAELEPLTVAGSSERTSMRW